tara:strand:- start:672 stop:1061 length:390 start_codon:yes stop_codon:yes gene_type:complete
MASFVTQTPIGDPKHAPWNNVVKHIDHLLTSLSVWVTNSQNTRDLVTQLSHLEHSLITPTSYPAFVAHCVINQRRYDMYCTHLTSQEIEQATAEYHMYKDMSAMAARIDQLEAENDRLQRALLNRKLIP